MVGLHAKVFKIKFDNIYTFLYIFTFQPFVCKISKNNGIIRLSQFFHLSPIKRNLKYLPGNIKDLYKKIYIELAPHKL
jgi:hypothetical protein